MRVTRASEALAKKFETRGQQKQMSEATRIGQSRLNRLANGILFPRADEAVRIAEAGGPPVEWWDTRLEQTDPDADDPESTSAAE